MATAPLTVRKLRERWQPHKDRLDGLRNSHPTSVRFHRACSWLEEAERLDPERQADQILLHQWIAFNALYGQWDLNLHEPVGDRTSWQVFLSRMLDLDAAGHLVKLLQENRRLVLTVLGNAFLSRYFWQDPGRRTQAGPGRRITAPRRGTRKAAGARSSNKRSSGCICCVANWSTAPPRLAVA